MFLYLTTSLLTAALPVVAERVVDWRGWKRVKKRKDKVAQATESVVQKTLSSATMRICLISIHLRLEPRIAVKAD